MDIVLHLLRDNISHEESWTELYGSGIVQWGLQKRIIQQDIVSVAKGGPGPLRNY